MPRDPISIRSANISTCAVAHNQNSSGISRHAVVSPVQMVDRDDDKRNEEIKPFQLNANNTGLPDNLKSGIENLSGFSMDDVKVHYNSEKPAQLQGVPPSS
jgi:hypothetical protein